MIGKPICVDQVTAKVDQISFAKIFVKVTPEETKHREVVLRNLKGVVFRHGVHFESLPWSCSHCNIFCHTHKYCKKKPKRVWVPNEKTPPSELPKQDVPSGLERE